MEPEYLALIIDPSYIVDTHHLANPPSSSSSSSSSLPANPTTPTNTDSLSNASFHSFSSSTSSSTSTSQTSSASSHLSPPRRHHRTSRSKSKSTAASSRSRSHSQSSDATGSLASILRLAGLQVLTATSFEDALGHLDHRPPTESQPMILLVDVDSELELASHAPGSYSTRHRAAPHMNGNGRGPGPGDSAKHSQGSNQRQLRATNDNTSLKGPHNRGRRPPSRPPKQNGLDGAMCGLDFLDIILQAIAKGSLHHLVPVAISSTTSQDRILELFNLGVADVLLKPIDDQVAKTLFLNVHRHTKYRTSVTIPRYATQKNSLALPSHTRMRNVFLKDQWLSDILISHYCPTPSKMTLHDFPSMTSQAAQERVKDLKKKLLSWDFHPHDLSENDLMRCVVIVIQEVMKLDGLGDLNIPEHLLHRFVIGLRDSYHRSNPYHNFAHAVDVLQATFYFLCRMGKLPQTGTGYPSLPRVNGCDANEQESQESQATTEESTTIPLNDTIASSTEEDTSPPHLRVQDFLRPEDIFALIVASIGHDVGHPGVNNMFLINAHTPLAQVYNDRSVLESFHSMALFQVMKKHGFECFDVDSQNRKFMEFRKMVVSTILATDMGLHFDYVGKIKDQTERLRLRSLPGGDVPRPNQANIDDQERLVLCGTLIKCADISNASRPFHVAERWSTVLLQEMCNQADIEKEMAVCSGAQSVPVGSTKSLANDCGMQIDSQLGFIHGFAMPLFSSVKDMIPEMGYCVDFLQNNHQIWQERKTEYMKNGGGPFTLIHNHTHNHLKPSSEDDEPSEPIKTTPLASLRKNITATMTTTTTTKISTTTTIRSNRGLNGKVVQPNPISTTTTTTKEGPKSGGRRAPPTSSSSSAALESGHRQEVVGTQIATANRVRPTSMRKPSLPTGSTTSTTSTTNGGASDPAAAAGGGLSSRSILAPRPRTRTLTSEGTAVSSVNQIVNGQNGPPPARGGAGAGGGVGVGAGVGASTSRYQDSRTRPANPPREVGSRPRMTTSLSALSLPGSLSDSAGTNKVGSSSSDRSSRSRPVSPVTTRGPRSPVRRSLGPNGHSNRGTNININSNGNPTQRAKHEMNSNGTLTINTLPDHKSQDQDQPVDFADPSILGPRLKQPTSAPAVLAASSVVDAADAVTEPSLSSSTEPSTPSTTSSEV